MPARNAGDVDERWRTAVGAFGRLGVASLSTDEFVGDVHVTRRAPWISGTAAGTTLAFVLALGGCDAKVSRRRYLSPCVAEAECESSLCVQGHCSYPCTTEDQCGPAGDCIGQVCLPAAATPQADAGCGGGADATGAVGSVDAATPPDACAAPPAPCLESPCRALPPQCGCPSGQACYLPTGAPVCRPAGATTPGGACTQDNDCRAGSVCITGLPTGNHCAILCGLGVPQSCASAVCMPTGLPGVGACMVACDPVTQTGCGARACYILKQQEFGYVTFCGTLGGKQGAGGNCAGMADCAPGLTCAGGTCAPQCKLATGGCAAGTTCQGAVPPLKVGATEYGVCKAPP
ncbi:MAG: hypothetical protein EXR79_11715 [Myxococcales bacterium]|nr:hypothetical protein [Myxococcales bacterium]